ncbi:MAG: hypothetical protein LQ352_000611 [Teloschistes flavicans]|nr:MAG: hypothetical protein LQ352_000611 [Teloschistes flavicans]
MPNTSHELFSSPVPHVEEAMGQERGMQDTGQNRSSSLSDIGDRPEENTTVPEQIAPAAESDLNDTEAETERLEDSPEKSRRNTNLLHTAANGTYSFGGEMSPPRSSDAEATRTLSPSSSPRKRKRSDIESPYLASRRSPREVGNVNDTRPSCLANTRSNSDERVVRTGKWDSSPEGSDGEQVRSEQDLRESQLSINARSRRGKRRITKGEPRSPSSLSVDDATEPVACAEALDSNPDDVEMEEHGEYGFHDNGTKDEEGTEPNVTHPELLGMKEVLEQRRDEKIQYESTLLRYKLGSLQNKSKAEKAQLHGQYMQSVREIRDHNLEQANKEWYQIHKERRSREDDVPEYMYQFTNRRSQQITHQTAYNKEVSLLSGIAKYQGFPAAPEICGARPSEIDADFEKMGIVQQSAAPAARHPPALRTSLTANAVLQRPKAVADEHFLEQNPWANPQHPVHLHRQTSVLSRTASPLSNPAMPKRDSGINPASKQASAAAEGQARLHLSTGPSSAAVQPDRDPKTARQAYSARRESDAPMGMPARHIQAADESLTPLVGKQQSRLQGSKTSPLTILEKFNRGMTDEIHVRPYVPRMSQKADSPSAALISKIPTTGSPSNRFPVIKAEDIARLPGRSPTPQHYHRQLPVNGAANG